MTDASDPTSADWSDGFWDDDDPWIFEDEARDYVARLRAALPLTRDARVLDFGCGFGFVPRLLAPHVGTVAIWDASPAMRRRAAATLADVDRVTLLDLEAEAAPSARFEWILVNSVIQYLSIDELAAWLRRWRALLAPGGRIVVSDVWPPDSGVVREIAAVLAFAVRRGIVTKTIVGGLRRSRRHRAFARTRPLLRLDPGTLAAMAAAADLHTSRLVANLTYRRARFAVVLDPTS